MGGGVMDYYYQGYNGYWDGIWPDSIIAIHQLMITDDMEARAEFMRGWNEANAELILLEREIELKNKTYE